MYSDISIVAPDSAVAGSIVNFEVRIRNLQDYTIYAIPVIDVDGGRDEGSYETIVPEQTRSWYFQFTMPAESVTIIAESWCEDTFEWHLDDTAQKTVALEEIYAGALTRKELEYDETRGAIPVNSIFEGLKAKQVVISEPAVAGTITRKNLEYDETWGVIPVGIIPEGQRGIIHVWGRNDTAETQQMGIYWFVADPDGYVVQEYENWEAWPYTGPGAEHGFLSSRFNLYKVGKYIIWLELLMNRNNPQVVDLYIGDLCTVALEEFVGTISRKELEYDDTRSEIPVW